MYTCELQVHLYGMVFTGEPARHICGTVMRSTLLIPGTLPVELHSVLYIDVHSIFRHALCMFNAYGIWG